MIRENTIVFSYSTTLSSRDPGDRRKDAPEKTRVRAPAKETVPEHKKVGRKKDFVERESIT